ncbi:MAG: SDR family NAD(P)-dependent oxidoreductase [Oscillospiraceae bacterium]|jgi:NAD(P)-dependent dehydrogenase (short-subunit alcohol dehydrogenase family)|nr:SDR family NAD(P)-dependent oxidoreductase [Oscillospiraceae bacterium]
MRDFAGKIAFITGGAAGAGLGQAKVFSKAGMKVAIADIRQDALDKAAKDIIAFSGCGAGDVLPIQFDLTDREAYSAAADKTEEFFGGPPHLFIQTAGVNSFGPAEASTFDDFDWVLGVCLNAVVNGLIIVVPRMIKAYANKTECHIAVTSSMGGWGGNVMTAPYSAAKAAVNNLMESYYLALKPYGFGATALCPMNINSDIWATELRRPDKYKNSGYNTTPEVIELLKEHVSMGIDPVELAERFKKGIEDGVVYCVPYPNAYELITREQERKRNYVTYGGMVKEEAFASYMTELAAELKKKGEGPPVGDAIALFKKGDQVGFAKARQDIDWIDPSRKVT